ncbi:MAG: hypothetical protein IJA61_02325 [Clostridia bacterium]|nr:hypothetical protein [Clostridia bacterium]
MAKSQKAYFGLPYIVSLILTIIPFTHWVLSGVTRILRGHVIAGVLNLIPAVNFVFWILDLITMVTQKDITYWA